MLNFWSREKIIIVGCTVLFILIGMDGVLTLLGLELGAIEEVNPVMRYIIGKNPIAFMAVKLSLPIMLGFVFWRIRNRSHRFVAWSLGLVLIVYAVVRTFHVYWIVFYE